MGSSYLYDKYLTRSEIAAILNISAKHAGRLMCEMTTIRFGRKHRRVMRADFEDWLNAKREAAILPRGGSVREAALDAAAHFMGYNPKGSIALAAKKAGRAIAKG